MPKIFYIKILFRKIIKHYYISENNELKKFVDIKDTINNETITKSLLVVPKNDREKLLKYCHYITGHKNYHEYYYWNNLNEPFRLYIKNCKICVSKNKIILFLLLSKLYAINLKNFM